MLRTVWATVDGRRRLYLIDEGCNFVEPVKLYLDHLAALEKSPHTQENYCRHLARYFVFLEREHVDWRSAKPDDTTLKGPNKSDSAKDAQIARYKERVRALEERVQSLQQENELLYGKLTRVN